MSRALHTPATRWPPTRHGARRQQQGSSLFLVLVLLSVMAMGGLALARMSEVGTLAAGNTAARNAAVQASEVGVNTAYAAVRALANEDANSGNWYYATQQTQDADGIPTVNFDTAPAITVGTGYTVNYVVERVCTGTLPVADPLRQCLVRQVQLPESRAGGEQLDPPMARQFRITVRVSDPRNTRVWVQSLVTKG